MFSPRPHNTLSLYSQFSSYVRKIHLKKMGKNNRKGPSEECLILPTHPRHTVAPIVDTHTHLASTFAAYKQKYKGGKYENVYEFVRGLYHGKVSALVDVWCEAPVQKAWKEIADSAIAEDDRKDKWGDLEYWFVMGACQLDDFERADICSCAIPRMRRCSSVSVPRCQNME